MVAASGFCCEPDIALDDQFLGDGRPASKAKSTCDRPFVHRCPFGQRRLLGMLHEHSVVLGTGPHDHAHHPGVRDHISVV